MQHPNNPHELNLRNLLAGYEIVSTDLGRVLTSLICLKPRRFDYVSKEDFDTAVSEHRDRCHRLSAVAQEQRDIVAQIRTMLIPKWNKENPGT